MRITSQEEALAARAAHGEPDSTEGFRCAMSPAEAEPRRTTIALRRSRGRKKPAP